MCRSVAQAAAIGPPGRVDAAVAFTTPYPGQSAYPKYCGARNSAVRWSSTETPFGQ